MCCGRVSLLRVVLGVCVYVVLVYTGGRRRPRTGCDGRGGVRMVEGSFYGFVHSSSTASAKSALLFSSGSAIGGVGAAGGGVDRADLLWGGGALLRLCYCCGIRKMQHGLVGRRGVGGVGVGSCVLCVVCCVVFCIAIMNECMYYSVMHLPRFHFEAERLVSEPTATVYSCSCSDNHYTSGCQPWRRVSGNGTRATPTQQPSCLPP